MRTRGRIFGEGQAERIRRLPRFPPQECREESNRFGRRRGFPARSAKDKGESELKEIEALAALLENERPQEWENFPDIELYKDQLLSYMQRQGIWSKGDDALTGAMISNYIKMGLMPGPVDKKYTREHIAYLTAIQALKQVMSVADTGLLLRCRAESDMQRFYGLFRAQLDDALNASAAGLRDVGDDDLAAEILARALHAYADRIIYERMLSVLREREEARKRDEEETQKKEKEDKKKGKAD